MECKFRNDNKCKYVCHLDWEVRPKKAFNKCYYCLHEFLHHPKIDLQPNKNAHLISLPSICIETKWFFIKSSTWEKKCCSKSTSPSHSSDANGSSKKQTEINSTALTISPFCVFQFCFRWMQNIVTEKFPAKLQWNSNKGLNIEWKKKFVTLV